MAKGAHPKHLLLVLACGLAELGCSSGPSRAVSAAEFQRNAEAAYNEALLSFYDQDWVTVPILMEEVRKEYAGTRWARLAQLRIADAKYHQASYAEAVTNYRDFIRDYPSDPEVQYARYRVALCQFAARGDSVLSPPLEERDLVNVRDAEQTITAFLRDYPDYKERERLLYMQSWVRGMLARHELYVARFYLREDNYEAALSRTEYALRNIGSTGLEAEALVLLGEVHLQGGNRSEAERAFSLVLEKFPKSPFAVAAKNFIEFMAKNPGVGVKPAAAAASGGPTPSAG